MAENLSHLRTPYRSSKETKVSWNESKLTVALVGEERCMTTLKTAVQQTTVA